ncbi:hypothetical protein FSPOR_6082 [Fusarium sporotrichioides]|uniref:Uncharacterized protein n=1 Tax=Fusarium sporotrichioides TaxID=5514 RepID=A0A395S5B7_FUSSP|nr:hypothetical protein FSPOR_6082 [Fusarium sporotrichioides]
MDNFPRSSPRHKIRPSDDVSAYEPFNSGQEHRGLGKPMKRRLCDVSEIAALFLSFCCSIVGLICCFHDASAANLGQKYQLIVVGLMLSIMDLCTGKLSTIVFLQLETRWASLLQNYDVIVKRSVLGSLLNMRRGSQRWTLLLSASLAFPLLLSIGYKTFVGGNITTPVFASGGEYGLTGPVGLANFSSGASLMVNATIPFIFSNLTKLPSHPQPFGFNMLVLPNEPITVAMLDGPSPSYVDEVRAGLEGQQYYTVTSDVHGLAWHLDNEADKHRDDKEWWGRLYNKTDPDSPRQISLFKWNKWLSTWWPAGQVKQFFILLTHQESDGTKSPTKGRFRRKSLEFTSQQLNCNGKWKITRSSVDLIDGNCDDGSFEKELPEGCRTLHLNDAVYILGDFVSDLLTSKLDEAGQMRLTAVVSSLFWSRLTAYCGIGAPTNHLNSTDMAQFKYYRQDEAWKTVGVLKRTPLLASILLAQPIVGLVLLIFRVILCSSPVSGGFGLTSVLASHGPREGNILSGAGLSGEVKERIQLDFNMSSESCDNGGERLEFQLMRARNLMHQDRKKLRSRVTYY